MEPARRAVSDLVNPTLQPKEMSLAGAEDSEKVTSEPEARKVSTTPKWCVLHACQLQVPSTPAEKRRRLKRLRTFRANEALTIFCFLMTEASLCSVFSPPSM